MEIVKSRTELRELVGNWKRRSEKVGFVPTMGFLHQGHLSLIKMSRQKTKKTIVSIFVNPAQFNDPKDFNTYPVDLEHDRSLLEKEGADVLYLPDPLQMYPDGVSNNRIWVIPEELDKYLCGQSRPGHFRGVLTIVIKLLNQVNPDLAFFGKKDYQQARLIEEMVSSFFMPVKIVMCDTTREEDGLAMSSRNVRLSPAARKEAPSIFRILKETRELYLNGETSCEKLREFLTSRIKAIPLSQFDYVEIVNKQNLHPYQGDITLNTALIATAIFFEEVRLIDNLEL